RYATAFLRLSDVRSCFGVLRRELTQTFFVKMNAALVPINLALQFQTALLRVCDFVLQFGEPLAQLSYLIFATQHGRGFSLDFIPQIVRGILFLAHLSKQHVQLMPRELCVEML